MRLIKATLQATFPNINGAVTPTPAEINQLHGLTIHLKDGCLAYNSGNQNVLNVTNTLLSWDTEAYDTSSIHDTVTNNSRFTVPANVSLIQMFGSFVSQNSIVANCQVLLSLYKNGSTLQHPGVTQALNFSSGLSGSPYISLASPPLQVSPGDYFEWNIWQNSGGTIATSGGYSYGAMRLLA